jgi:hypothetical protein
MLVDQSAPPGGHLGESYVDVRDGECEMVDPLAPGGEELRDRRLESGRFDELHMGLSRGEERHDDLAPGNLFGRGLRRAEDGSPAFERLREVRDDDPYVVELHGSS